MSNTRPRFCTQVSYITLQLAPVLFPCCSLDGRPWRKCRLSNNRLPSGPYPFPQVGSCRGAPVSPPEETQVNSPSDSNQRKLNNKMGWDLFKSSRSKII